MRFAVFVSKNDPAGMNIRECLSLLGFAVTGELYDGSYVLQYRETKAYTISNDSIFFHLCDAFPADIILFATRHQSKKGVPSLCTHAVGNWGMAEMGGKDKALGFAPAFYIKRTLQLLEEKKISGYEVFQEATHHGPSSRKPVIFIEIGASLSEYQDRNAGMIIAETIIELLSFDPNYEKTAVGVGGPHHTPNFKKIQLQSDIALGHICPKYNLQHLTKEMVLQAIAKTVPRAELLILDRKGLGEEKEQIKKVVEDVALETGIKVLRCQEF